VLLASSTDTDKAVMLKHSQLFNNPSHKGFKRLHAASFSYEGTATNYSHDAYNQGTFISGVAAGMNSLKNEAPTNSGGVVGI